MNFFSLSPFPFPLSLFFGFNQFCCNPLTSFLASKLASPQNSGKFSIAPQNWPNNDSGISISSGELSGIYCYSMERGAFA